MKDADKRPYILIFIRVNEIFERLRYSLGTADLRDNFNLNKLRDVLEKLRDLTEHLVMSHGITSYRNLFFESYCLSFCRGFSSLVS